MDKLSQIKSFRSTVWEFYGSNQRNLPWRHFSENTRERFYEVVVSEIMLQQTQVSRVVEKYEQWMAMYQTMDAAAAADFKDILTLWQGLGYNRRARYLHETLKVLSKLEEMPSTEAELQRLPGIGKNTAGAILAYCFNEPSTFIETNIRTVYMYHFPELLDNGRVHDSKIQELVRKTVDKKRAREWYWALMDYGTYLKSQGIKNHMSLHYTRQSKFEGSTRQLRARLVREILGGQSSIKDLEAICADPRFPQALQSLVMDKTLEKSRGKVFITGSGVK